MAVASSSNPILESGTIIGGIQILTGFVAPTIVAPKGSLFIRLDAGANSTSTRLYVNTTGAGVWTPITTVA